MLLCRMFVGGRAPKGSAAREEAERAGFDMVTDNSVPGTSGLPGVAQIAADGYAAFTF